MSSWPGPLSSLELRLDRRRVAFERVLVGDDHLADGLPLLAVEHLAARAGQLLLDEEADLVGRRAGGLGDLLLQIFAGVVARTAGGRSEGERQTHGPRERTNVRMHIRCSF